MASTHTRAALLTSILVLGCGPEGPPNVPVSSASAPPSQAAAPADAGVFPSKRFGVSVHLTDGASWHIDDTRTPWLVAAEPSTSSSLLVRTWRDENRMTHDKCEERARGWRKLPSRDGATIIEHETLDLPAGFDTAFDVGLVPDHAHDGLFGFILAFGGYSHKCFAFVYVTRDEGKGSDARVAERLASIAEGTLKKLRFETDLAPPPSFRGELGPFREGDRAPASPTE